MRRVTAEEVKKAVMAMHKTIIPDHRCSVCDVMVHYEVYNGELFFNPNCGCTTPGMEHKPEPRAWSDLAYCINIQISEKAQANMLERFNLPLEDTVCP